MSNRPQRHHNLIAVFRRRLGLTQREFASLAGYRSDSQVSRLEVGSRQPNMRELVAIELCCGVETYRLFPKVKEEIRRQVQDRISALLEQLRSKVLTERRSYKIQQLEFLLASIGNQQEFSSRSRVEITNET